MKRFKVTVTFDRPKGYRDDYGNVYPINYGYVEGVIAGDGEGQDAYVLTDEEVTGSYTGEVIAVIIRSDDQEDKWVVAAEDADYSIEEIYQQVDFIEQYFHSEILLLDKVKRSVDG